MASTTQTSQPIRKSSRIAKQAEQRRNGPPSSTASWSQPEPRKPLGPNDPFSETDTACKRFMRALYEEIHDSTLVDMGEEKTRRIQDLIRRTRTRHFINGSPRQHRIMYDGFVQNGFRDVQTVPDRQMALEMAMIHFQVDNTPFDTLDDFLAQLAENCGYPILSICLHSSTFLEYVRTGVDLYELDLDPLECADGDGERAKLGWQSRLDAICAARDSLELFAKLRHVDFRSPIRYYEEDFRLLFSTVFRASNTLQRQQDYGFGETLGMEEIHDVGHWQIEGKHWALPQSIGLPSEVCTITYTVTQELAREFPELSVGQQITEMQEDIPDSIILDGYTWPGRQAWPSDDPREDGFANPCWSCGIIRGPVPRRRPQVDRRPCRCTLADKQRMMNMPTDPTGAIRDVLYELITTERLGRGVRVLQNLEVDDVLGFYLGEIYPRTKLRRDELSDVDDDEDFVPNRYGRSGPGASYIFDEHMPNGRHAKSGNSTASAGKQTQPKKKKQKKKNSDTDDDKPRRRRPLDPLDPNEWKLYRVDSAVKGNWTRYINHSCDPNTRFCAQIVLGGKRYTAVDVLRNITFGDHMTVHYGDEYFINQDFGCKCGVKTCLLWNKDNIALELRTLQEAIEQGVGPQWTTGFDLLTPSESGRGIMKQELRTRRKTIREQRKADEQAARDDGGDGYDSDGDEDGDQDDGPGNGGAPAAKAPAACSTRKTGPVAKGPRRGAASRSTRANNGGTSANAASAAAGAVQGAQAATRRSTRATTEQNTNAADANAAEREKKRATATDKKRKRDGQQPAETEAPKQEEQEEEYETAHEEPSPHGRGKRKRKPSARAAEIAANEPAGKRARRK